MRPPQASCFSSISPTPLEKDPVLLPIPADRITPAVQAATAVASGISMDGPVVQMTVGTAAAIGIAAAVGMAAAIGIVEAVGTAAATAAVGTAVAVTAAAGKGVPCLKRTMTW